MGLPSLCSREGVSSFWPCRNKGTSSSRQTIRFNDLHGLTRLFRGLACAKFRTEVCFEIGSQEATVDTPANAMHSALAKLGSVASGRHPQSQLITPTTIIPSAFKGQLKLGMQILLGNYHTNASPATPLLLSTTVYLRPQDCRSKRWSSGPRTKCRACKQKNHRKVKSSYSYGEGRED